MAFYISFKEMLNEYGVDLTVYPYNSPSNKPHYHYVGGIKKPDKDTEEKAEPIQLHEPVLPFNSTNSFMAQFLAGGMEAQADLLWISSEIFPIDTIVEVPSQPGQKYRVVNYSNYTGYSDVIIYELKGDGEHKGGR